MTNEEAIKIIKSECYIADLLNLDRTQMVNTALDMAIKALGSWDKYSSELWKIAYDRGFKDGVRDGIQAME